MQVCILQFITSTYRLYLFKTGSSSPLAIRSEESLLGANVVDWKASHDVMTSATEIVNWDKRMDRPFFACQCKSIRCTIEVCFVVVCSAITS
jgi:hypothetical protein